MLSMVLTALNASASGAPPSVIYSSGAATPSQKFSATVSTAALATPSASRRSVSRPTMRATAFRAPGRSPQRRASYTLLLAEARPRAARACAHQKLWTASSAAGWSRRASRHTPKASAKLSSGSETASSVPLQSSPRGVFGKSGRTRRSYPLMYRPIQTTGCGSHAGSPKSRSSAKPMSIAYRISMPRPPLQSGAPQAGAAASPGPTARRHIEAPSPRRRAAAGRSRRTGARRSAPSPRAGSRRARR